ncbi:hypothetical protein DS300_25520, partial [Salmonella enterica subsp. enterica]|nr:hypothetical protein [Salmonella enterica subsp. enterica serovar Potsdam]
EPGERAALVVAAAEPGERAALVVMVAGRMMVNAGAGHILIQMAHSFFIMTKWRVKISRK